MATRKWPRKNDAASIQARQEALGLDGEVTGIDLEPFASAQEMLTGVAVTPVSVVGPIELELGDYELREPGGEVVETGRARDSVFVPLAHTEGGLSASMHRGALAVAESGGFRTYVLADRITRASCFVCAIAADAVELAQMDRGRALGDAGLDRRAGRPLALEVRTSARGEDARRRPDVPRPLALDDRRRGRRRT